MSPSGLSTLLAIIIGVLAVLAVVASGIAFLKTQIGEKTISLQKEEIAALEQRNRTLTNDLTELRGIVNALQGENRVLRELVTQEKAIALLTESLAKHHAASEQVWERILNVVEGERHEPRGQGKVGG